MEEWAGNQLLNVTPQKYGKDDPSVHVSFVSAR